MSTCECPPRLLHLGPTLKMSSCKLTVDHHVLQYVVCICMNLYHITQAACASCRNTEPISSGNRGLFAFVFALLIVPAGIILAIAFSSGYMVRSLEILTWVFALMVQCPRYSVPDDFTLIDCHKGCHPCDLMVKGECPKRRGVCCAGYYQQWSPAMRRGLRMFFASGDCIVRDQLKRESLTVQTLACLV